MLGSGNYSLDYLSVTILESLVAQDGALGHHFCLWYATNKNASFDIIIHYLLKVYDMIEIVAAQWGMYESLIWVTVHFIMPPLDDSQQIFIMFLSFIFYIN